VSGVHTAHPDTPCTAFLSYKTERVLQQFLPRKLHLTSEEKVIELVARSGGFTEQASRLMLNQAIATGRGGALH
jgi:hypothetical protein